MKKILIVLLFLLINLHQVFAQAVNRIQELEVEVKGKLEDKKFDSIRFKFPLIPSVAPNLGMLSDNTKSNSLQKKSLTEYQSVVEYYQTQMISLTGGAGSPFNSVLLWRHDEVIRLLTEIYSNKITWGDFNKQWKEISPEFNRRVAEIAQRQKSIAIQQAKDLDESKKRESQEIENRNIRAAQQAKSAKVEACNNAIRKIQAVCKQNPNVTINNNIAINSDGYYGNQNNWSSFLNSFDPVNAINCSQAKQDAMSYCN